MNPIKVLLVDDEYLALQLLDNFVKEIPDLEIIDKVKSPIEAIDILSKEHVDILFLDVQMPTLSGINLLKTIKNKPITIFTTAYTEYAVNAFDLDAIDYLLKPFSFERFLQSVNKAKEQLNKNQSTAIHPQNSIIPNDRDFIVVKSDSKMIKVFYKNILFIEGLKEYVKIVCYDQKIVTLMSLKQLIEELPGELFARVHKSYIINISKVKSLEGNQLEIDSHKIPVSRDRKNDIMNQIFK